MLESNILRSLRFPDLVETSQLTAHLLEVAKLPPGRRLLFLGLLEPVLTHASPEVRAAAHGCLAGAHGVAAWRLLVRGLDDADPAVRAAAVAALRRSAAHDPARWVHAVYHPEVSVREQAGHLGPPAPPGPEPTPPYQWRGDVETLLAQAATLGNLLAVQTFLEKEPRADPGLRLRAAVHLAENGQLESMIPLLVTAEPNDERVLELLKNAPVDLIEAAARGVAALGEVGPENLLVNVLHRRPNGDQDETAVSVLLTSAVQISTRRWARSRLPAVPQRDKNLARLAATFLWGIDVGLLLTRERFKIQLIVGDRDLGYTRLNTKTIWISGRPIFDGDRQGDEVVRGLILHENGHHLYHKTPDAARVHKTATLEGLDRLLNLVEDEHLERNLRQRSDRYGDLLKTLAAYAFLHSRREVPVEQLLQCLGDRAAEVLPRVTLGAARRSGHVVVSSGKLLRAMEDGGHSFARFVRALRCGLGNRSGDPKVTEALALFKGGFRKSTMPQLLDIARKLKEIFGDDAGLLAALSQDRVMEDEDEADWLEGGQGITPEAVTKQVDQLLEQREQERKGGGGGLNLGPEESFSPITQVIKLDPIPSEHAAYASRVARAARNLRRYFEGLGLGMTRQRFRLSGRQLDRARLRDMVLKADPRVLLSRQVTRVTDLFLGVAIDCSGSMSGGNIEKAQLFGTLLAEALKGQRGVDLRLFGFEDYRIWDVGTADRCAVHRLRAGGGNNDAAALWHVAQVARASRRKGKLLVMISDGLPSACTVNALRALVKRLTRQKYCCAQVAVQPLSEVCFPHYVLLQEQDLDASTRRFGAVVSRLVGKALGQA